MAKVKYDPNMGLNHNFEIGGNFEEGEMLLSAHTKTKATFTNDTNQFTIVLEGVKFKYDGDELVGGNVDKITFRDDDGDKLATISDFTKSASSLTDALFGGGGIGEFFSVLLQRKDQLIGSSSGEYLIGEAGNDRMNGKGGNDFVDGNSGNDIMTGGGGHDEFGFYGSSGKDVITDFDLGHEGSFDTLFINGVTFEVVKAGKNDTRIEFEDGSSVLLEGIKFKDAAEIDFNVPL